MKKKIGPAKRGLTFSVPKSIFGIGDHFRYFIDKKNREVVIVKDANGHNTVSRKRSGTEYRPLFDLRSADVRQLVQDADYMEVSVKGTKIVVSCIKEVSAANIQTSNIIHIGDVLGVEIGKIELSAAVGYTGSRNITPADRDSDEYFSYLCSQIPSYHTKRKEFKRIYDVISLFSGAGLLDYSFRDPQFRFVYGVDFDKDACETYRNNIGEHIQCADIREVDAKDIPGCDVVIGGPCCQAYSNANRVNIDTSEGEAKRLLIDDYIRIVKAKNPAVFVIENVPQLLTKENGRYIKKVFDELAEYEISCSVVNDGQVGGYSIRKRAIVIGSRIGKIELPEPEIATLKTVREALSKVDATWFNFNDVTEPRESTKEAMSYVPQGGNWQDVPEEIQKKHGWGKNTQSNVFRRLALDALSPTICNWRKSSLTHPTENRILTVAEAAAIMGLDKNFKIFGTSLNSRQQQIGNGVTQAIGRFVKNTVLGALNAHYQLAVVS